MYITTCTPQKRTDNDKANALSLNELSVPKGPMDEELMFACALLTQQTDILTNMCMLAARDK